MCRMALLPKDYKGDKIVKLLDHLEKAMGGDGNGFGYYKEDGSAEVIKGLKVSNKTINTIEPFSEMVMYHSRKASVGEMDDDNTQPFVTIPAGKDKESFLLCHNGTWTSHTDYKKILLMLGKLTVAQYQCWSDTHFMAWLISTQGEDRLDLPSSGVWLQMFADGHAIAHVRSGDFQAFKLGKKWIYASEFPKEGYPKVWDFKSDSKIWMHPDKGFKVLEGAKPEYKENWNYSGTSNYYYKNEAWDPQTGVWKNDKDDGVKKDASKFYYYDKTGKKCECTSYLEDYYGRDY